MKAYFFDLDSTLVRQWSSDPLPGVIAKLESLESLGTPLAILTNQAGIAWRLWTGQEKFPSAADMADRYLEIAAKIWPLRQAMWLTAIYDERVNLPAKQWRGLAASLTLVAKPLAARTSSSPTWRKPQPGMLLEACRAFGIRPADAIFVGDMESDRLAAQAAGILFLWPHQFFGG